MPVQIKPLIDPPEWFNLDNYEYTNDIEDWFYNIALRSSIISEINFIKESEQDIFNFYDLLDEINDCRKKRFSYF